MKMTTEHFNELKDRIEHRLSADREGLLSVERYREGKFNNADKCRDVQKRYCFDLLYSSVPASWVCRELYPYLDDGHIYTALKQICPKV